MKLNIKLNSILLILFIDTLLLSCENKSIIFEKNDVVGKYILDTITTNKNILEYKNNEFLELNSDNIAIRIFNNSDTILGTWELHKRNKPVIFFNEKKRNSTQSFYFEILSQNEFRIFYDVEDGRVYFKKTTP